MDLKMFLRCLFSPSLYSIHRGSSASVGKYDPNDWERWGDNFITSLILLRALTIYTSPVLVFYLSRKGYLTLAGTFYLAKVSLGIGVLVGASYCIRSYGRVFNSKYTDFIQHLESCKADYRADNKVKLRNYDFEFSAWPVDYEYKRGGRGSGGGKRRWSSVLSPCGLLCYIVMHTVGIKLIYPGSIPFVSYLMNSLLIQGRHRLVVNEQGQRFKVKTEDGNHIDTMFLDRRNDSSRENGSTLVICSEGNAGFYEIGIMATPVEGNFSVLGWNHPGFGASTGVPYVDQEQCAVDAVMQLAIERLGFRQEDIVLFGWSIGGFSTAYAASNYPQVKAVIMDASFDDLLPLAIPRMPSLLEPVVKQSIRLEANLDVARKLCNYPGPVLLVRRSKDEVICIEPDDISTNRGNHLVERLLTARYPNLLTDSSRQALWEWLSLPSHNQTSVMLKYEVNTVKCKQILASYFSLNDQEAFPLQLGEDLHSQLKTQLLLYLASKYYVDFDSTHCTVLPLSLFYIPTLPAGQ